MHSETVPDDVPGEAPLDDGALLDSGAVEVAPPGADAGSGLPTGMDGVDLEPLGGDIAAGLPSTDLAPVADVPVELVVEIGRTKMSIGETLSLGPGSVVSLDKQTGEPVGLLVNGTPIARGEVIAVDEEFGIRLTEVLPPERRLDAAG